jgi:GNAT superfamily N-acetyltransferase
LQQGDQDGLVRKTGYCEKHVVTADFLTMDDHSVAQFIQEHQHEFGDSSSPHKLASILAAINAGERAIIRRKYGFAVAGGSVLWYLYAAPPNRGKGGEARKLVQEVVEALGGRCELLCYGTDRRAFFERCGFRATDPNDVDHFTMEYP